MGINYVNDNIGKVCQACKKGVIYYYHSVKKDAEVEVIGCTNNDCKGFISPE